MESAPAVGDGLALINAGDAQKLHGRAPSFLRTVGLDAGLRVRHWPGENALKLRLSATLRMWRQHLHLGDPLVLLAEH
jgi:hypothetical protein